MHMETMKTSWTCWGVRAVCVVAVCWLLVVSGAHAEVEEEEEEEGFEEFEFDLPEEMEEGELEEGEGEEEEGEEGFEENEVDWEEFDEGQPATPMGKLEIAESAVRVKPIWEAYVLEMLVAVGMVLYGTNYFIGRSKNSSIVYTWLEANGELLETNFTLVGDTGEGEEPTEGRLVKESDHLFYLWASGRANCSGMLVQFKLHRRHDLLAVLYSLVKAQPDTMTVVFQLEDDDMDTFVLALGQKKAIQSMQKDYEDLSLYCSSIRPGTKLDLDPSLHVLSEIPEATSSFLSSQIVGYLNKHASTLESLHISDQYTGFLQDSEEAEVVVVRKPQKRIQLTYSMPMDAKPDALLRFALLSLDHTSKLRLSKEGREKAQKNRSKVAQTLDKLQHSQRQEAAQQRKEEKKRSEKERLMAENDPDKARKWEEREHKKAMKKMQPRMKQMKARMG